MKYFLSIFVVASTQLTPLTAYCPPLGPILPASRKLKTNTNFLEVISLINAQLTNYTSSLNETALSVGARSIHEAEPLLNFHHTPSTFNQSGTHRVDGDTVYRIGSATKLFTALSVLQLEGKVNLAETITKYVPELEEIYDTQDGLSSVDWDSVTVESLLSHLGGIGADLGGNAIQFVPGLTQEIGLPQLGQDEDSLSCGYSPDVPGCTWEDFYRNFDRRPPVYAPFTTPVYSNIGYSILGRLVEKVSGKSYSQYLQDAIFAVAKLNRTYVNAPANSSLGFIPSEVNWWGTSLGFESSSGDIYSSNNDLLSFGTSILSSKLLRPEQTRAWLKPRSFTSSSGVFVGAPWEIARGANLTSDGRVVDFYTKTGNLEDYTAIVALVPDYDLVIAINIAGGSESSISAIQIIFSTLVQALIPAVDQAGKEDATQQYAGTYSSGINSSLSLFVDESGLVVSNFSVSGADVTTGYAALMSSDPGSTSIRLYLTNLRTTNQTAWRAVYSTTSEEELATFDAQLFFPQGSCQTWSLIDLQSYGLEALDYFIITTDSEGQAITVEPKAWRVKLTREN